MAHLFSISSRNNVLLKVSQTVIMTHGSQVLINVTNVQMCGSSDTETKPEKLQTYLSYILEVQPKRWIPVALIEGVLGHEITCNLVSVRNVALRNNSL